MCWQILLNNGGLDLISFSQIKGAYPLVQDQVEQCTDYTVNTRAQNQALSVTSKPRST